MYVHVGEGESESNKFFKVLAIGLVKNHVMTSKCSHKKTDPIQNWFISQYFYITAMSKLKKRYCGMEYHCVSILIDFY